MISKLRKATTPSNNIILDLVRDVNIYALSLEYDSIPHHPNNIDCFRHGFLEDKPSSLFSRFQSTANPFLHSNLAVPYYGSLLTPPPVTVQAKNKCSCVSSLLQKNTLSIYSNTKTSQPSFCR